MKHLLTVNIPGPAPSLNNAYFNNAHGGRTMQTSIKNWKAGVTRVVANAIALKGLDFSPHQKKDLGIEIYFYVPALHKSDWDGHVKIIQDAVIKAMGLDDAYIVEAHVYKDLDKEDPRSSVNVYAI